MKTTNTIDCNICRSDFSEVLLEPGCTLSAEMMAHLAACTACSQELAELQATMLMLDEWTAPEPSPYFDARVHAHLREEVSNAAPASLWERLAAALHLSAGRGFRPALAAAFVFVLLLGGTAATVWGHHDAAPTAQSPTVKDLQIDDNNAQALQQLDLLDDQGASGQDAVPQS